MPEKQPNSPKPVLHDTIPVDVYRQLLKFVKACGDVESAHKIASLLTTMTISSADLLEGLTTLRKH